jgi:DNA-binding transcriptional LysR family regulator
MKLRQIEFALAVAEESSFTRAAQRCNTVQSALSHQIASLERELGATLFERTSRQVRLTAAGEAFVRQARLTLETVRRIPDEVAAASGQVCGSLAVGTITSMTAIDTVALLASFNAKYAHVDISLNLGDSEDLLNDVRERRLDVAFLGLWHGEQVQGVELLRLAEEKLLAVLPLAHPLSGRKQLTLQKLADQPLVDFPRGSSARRQTDEAFTAAGLNHKVRFEVGHMTLIERFVSYGLAVALVPEPIAATFKGVVSIPVLNAPKRVLYAVWSKSPLPAAVAFVALLREELVKITNKH